ncbi:DnaJ domain-containing protein, partial [Acinetobacter soli]
VNPYASTEKIKESYYKQIKRFNNEVFPEHFLLIKEAYEYLSDPVRRKNYLNELNPTTSNHQSD